MLKARSITTPTSTKMTPIILREVEENRDAVSVPARISIVTVDRISTMEFRDTPIAGIEVRGEENFDKKQITQMIAQLMR